MNKKREGKAIVSHAYHFWDAFESTLHEELCNFLKIQECSRYMAKHTTCVTRVKE